MSDLWIIVYKVHRLSADVAFLLTKIVLAGRHESLLRGRKNVYLLCVKFTFTVFYYDAVAADSNQR